ncbi:hypothetical protein [Nocardia rhizosphaerae]|uniref:LexA repressor DNA-binding domain-containing protein n=1 Tax=Nocardia rhizosphaerae TaxID=1691571 RepID=A0ABV8LFC8_9NOCA
MSLTRCQRWILESLHAVAPGPPAGVACDELAALLGHGTYRTGLYLDQLHAAGLVAARPRDGELHWWVNRNGRAALKPARSARAQRGGEQMIPGPDGNAGNTNATNDPMSIELYGSNATQPTQIAAVTHNVTEHQ